MSDRHNQHSDANSEHASLDAKVESSRTDVWIPTGDEGRLVREYRLIHLLGAGGMGQVYKAVHTRLRRLVALKILPESQLDSPDSLARFHREMAAVGQLDHPHVVRAYDAGEHDCTHFLVMEYIEGFDLAKLLKRVGPLRIADACEIIRQASDGLQHVHEHGLVHRDIKPSNIILSTQGQVKILDLGLARLRHRESLPEDLTVTGQVMGTVDYMAPEQLTHAHSVDIRADIYSLGCTLFRLLAGQAPFAVDHGSPAQVLLAHLHTPPPPVASHRPDVPRELEKALQRMLAKDPDDRFPSPREVCRAMEAFTDQHDLVTLASCGGANDLAEREPGREHPSTQVGVASAISDTSVDEPRQVARRTAQEAQLKSADAGELVRGTRQAMVRRRGWYAAGGLVLCAAIVLTGKAMLELNERAGVEVSNAQAPIAPVVAREHRPSRVLVDREITPLQVFEGHSGQVNSLAVSPDEQFAISGGVDATLRVWDLKNGRELRPSMKHAESIWGVAISPDGKYAVAGGGETLTAADVKQEDDIRLWNLTTNEEVRRFKGHTGRVNCLAFSSDGNFVFSGSFDNTVRQWRVSDGQPVAVFEGHRDAVTALALSPDDRLLVSGSCDTTVRIWDVRQAKELHSLQGHWELISAVSFAPDARHVLSGSIDTTLRLWDITTGREVRQYRGHQTGILSTASTPDGDVAVTSSGTLPLGRGMASAGWDYRLRLWNVRTGRQLMRWHSGDAGVMHMKLLAGGRLLLTAGVNGTLRLWEIPARDAGAMETVAEDPAASVSWAWPADKLQAGEVRAPELSGMAPVVYDEFDRSDSGFFSGYFRDDEHDTRFGYEAGRYVIEPPVEIGVHSTPGRRYANFACQMAGRIATPHGRWGMSIANQQNHGLMITLDVGGQLRIEPDLFEVQSHRGPRLGPLRHPAIRAGNEFNTLLVMIHGRQVEVYVNSVAVIQPFDMDRDIIPAQIKSAYGTGATVHQHTPRSRIELENLIVWPAESIPTLEARGAIPQVK